MSIRQGSKYQDTYRTNQNSETEQDWRRRDVGFRRSLPDAMYVKRSVYRSAILKSCKRLEWFDGGAILTKERERAPVVLGDLLDNYGRNYLIQDRREDDEEDYEYEDEQGYGYEDDYYQQQQNQQQYGDDWVDQRAQLEQLNQESLHNGDEEGDFDADERDPEDITDHSKRQSSLDSGSMNGRRQVARHHQLGRITPKSPLSRFTTPAVQAAPRRLRSQSGYSMSSPTPKEHSKLRSAGAPTPTRLKASISSGRQEEGEEEVVEYEGSSDKRSAVQNWRDEVNEVSQRKLIFPRGVGPIAATPLALRNKQLMSHHSDKGSHSGHSSASGRSSASAHGSRNGGSSGLRQETMETSTGAVGQRSCDDRPAQERRTSRQKFSIPAPTPIGMSMSASWTRPPMHSRRRSDSTSAMMVARGSPLQQHELRSVYLQQQQQHPHQTQLFAASSPMTASGTLLRSSHLRRRSFGLYPHHSASAVARRKEMLGLDQSQLTQSPAFGATSVQLPTPGSPGYHFGMGHHYSSSSMTMQSPYGSGKVPLTTATIAAAAGHGTPHIGATRSTPNTPSRGGGRLSRVSQGTHHYPQTLARDMERSVTVD